MSCRSLIKTGTLACILLAGIATHAMAADDSLTIAYPTDVPSWDPASNTNSGAQSIYKSVFGSPLEYTPDVKLAPGIIKSWKWEDSQDKRLALTLRDDVLFQDGSKLTTEDLKFSYVTRPQKDPTLLVSKILAPIQDIEVKSPTEAVIVFKNSAPTSPLYLGFMSTFILPKTYIEKVGDAGFREHPIGAGPYKLVRYERGSRIILEAFDKYYGGEARIKHVTVQIITDPSARVAAVEAGRVDFASALPLREVKRLESVPTLVAKVYPAASEIMLVHMPSYVKSLDDEKVRLAMALSIDKAAIAKAFYGGISQPLSVLAAPGTVGAVPGFTFPYDKARAIALLKQAGYGPDQPLKVDFATFNGVFPNDYDIARAIAAMWKQIGIQADIQEVTLAKYLDLSHSASLPGPTVYSWFNTTGDPENTIGRMLDGAAPFSAWKGKEATDRVHALLTEPDENKRLEGYRQLEKDATEHAWSIPIVQTVFAIAYKKGLNVVTYGGGYILPYDFSWAPAGK